MWAFSGGQFHALLGGVYVGCSVMYVCGCVTMRSAGNKTKNGAIEPCTTLS